MQSTISVAQPTTLSLPDLDPLCETDGPIDLLSNHQGIVGIWTGPGVSHPFFNPSGLAGDQVLTFTPDPGQCANPALSTISVTQPTSVSLPGLDPLCENDDPIDLLSNHQGIAGIWSGPGVNHPFFNPSGLAGDQVLTFTPDPGQCADPAQSTISVTQPTSFSLPDLDPLCENDDPIDLLSNHQGIAGIWSGPRVNHPFFDPSGLAGDQVLTFTPDPGQCADPAQSTISVTQPTSVSLPGLDPLCENDDPIDLLSNHQGIVGIWSGPGVNHPFFDPSGLAVDQVLTFTPDPGQCANSAQSTISVAQPTSVSLPGLDPLCENDDPIDLLSNHQGVAGIWSGPGVSHPFFDPSGLAGDQVLTFTPDPGQCAEPAQSTIAVTKAETIVLPTHPPICTLSAALDLGDSHSGVSGTWSGPGVNHPIFNPSGLSGDHILTFTPDPGQCSQSSEIGIAVQVPRRPSLSLSQHICATSDPIDLATMQDGMVGNWHGPGVTENAFDPNGHGGELNLTFVPDEDQCGLISSLSLTIVDTITIETDLPRTLCQSSGGHMLNQIQSGIKGTWTGIGISENTFDPHGVTGIVSLLFTPDQDQCAASVEAKLEIITPSQPEVDIPNNICPNGPQLGLKLMQENLQGTWSGPGVADDVFDPSNLQGDIRLTFQPLVGQCAMPVSTVITIRTPPELDMDIIHPICHGEESGMINLSISGEEPIRYDWNVDGIGDFDDAKDLVHVGHGHYELIIMDAHGCRFDTSASLLNPDSLRVNIISGKEGNDYIAEVTGGTPPYQYYWSSGDSTESTKPMDLDTLILSATDQNQCTTSTQLLLASPCNLEVSIQSEDIACHGDSSGMAQVSVSGGKMPYTFDWSHDDTLAIGQADKLWAGKFAVTTTEAGGCSRSDTFEMTSPTPMTLEAVFNHETGNKGSITLKTEGGESPYHYAWDNGMNTPTLEGLTPGNYRLTVTDNAGCQIDTSFKIDTFDCQIDASITWQVGCIGQNNGEAQVSLSDTLTKVTFQWSHDSSLVLSKADHLGPGYYIVTVSDHSGCRQHLEFEINADDFLELSIESVDVTKAGIQDGWIKSQVRGGNAPVRYAWSNGASTDSIGGLKPGPYSVTVTDQLGCSDSSFININDFACTLSAAVAITDPACHGDATGTAILSATSAAQPVDVIWQHDSAWTNNIATGLNAGSYTLTVYDADGCTHQLSYIITDPPEITISLELEHQQGVEAHNGMATANVTGGHPEYTYMWSNGSVDNHTDDLAPGLHSVTVTDSKGCRQEDSFEILPYEICQLKVEHYVTNPSCRGNDGSIQVELTNVAGIPKVSWPGLAPEGTYHLSDLSAGLYTVFASDDHCSTTDSIWLTIDSIVGIDYDLGRSICDSSPSAKLTFHHVLGGQDPYSISIDDTVLDDLSTPTILGVGSHDILVTDQNGCRFEELLFIDEQTQILVSDHRTIKRGEEIQIQATIMGGDSELTYRWFTDQSPICDACLGFIASPEQTETYHFQVQDRQGCMLAAHVTITVDERQLFFIPNVITLNGDGLNDELIVYDGKDLIDIIESIEIYNKEGLLVHKASDFPPNLPISELEGQLEKVITPEVFMYLIRIRFKQGYARSYQGSLHILK